MIPVSQPYINGRELALVTRALKRGELSGLYGEYLPKFEKNFSKYVGSPYGVSASNGTTALHLALLSLSIGKGDEVLVSTLTNMATFFAVLYVGARPVPIDIEEGTWNLDPSLLESKINPRTKAIMVVHLFGHPVDMDPVMAVAKKHRLSVIEDCAEAHGAVYKGRKVGSIGHAGCFSFYANKIITTGEGGMLTTANPKVALKARSLRNLAFGHENKFMHTDIGYNYKMTNYQAAVGCAQLEKIEKIIALKRKLAEFYTSSLNSIDGLNLPVEKSYARNVYWMYHLVLGGRWKNKRARIMRELAKKGIETREGFVPYNLQKIFIRKGWTRPGDCPKANEIAFRSFYLPSGVSLTQKDRQTVADTLKKVLERS